jgi:orotate phosphoribosyltransferase
VGLATAGVPIATAISLQGGYPMGYTRKLEGVKNLEQFQEKISQYGQHSLVEGIFESGDSIALVDDLVTRLNSKLIGREQMLADAQRRDIVIRCSTIVVLVDREQGAQQAAAEYGLSLHSLIPFRSKALEWLRPKFSELEYKVLTHYFQDPEFYQNEQIQQDLIARTISE